MRGRRSSETRGESPTCYRVTRYQELYYEQPDKGCGRRENVRPGSTKSPSVKDRGMHILYLRVPTIQSSKE